jgi:hypothetical protein
MGGSEKGGRGGRGGRGTARVTFTALTALSALTATTACSNDDRTPVVLYSPHGRDQLSLLEKAFEERRPDIDVRWLDMGSQEILDRLRFERVNPQADVWFGGPVPDQFRFSSGEPGTRCLRPTGRCGPTR